MSKKSKFRGPQSIDLSRENSFLAIVTQQHNISNDFESLKSFLKNYYCGDGHSSPGGERSIKSYYIVSELMTSVENDGVLDIEKRIIKNNLILAKPDIWIVNGIVKAIEIEPKVPQRQKVKHKVDLLKSNGADKVLIAISYNPENETRTIKQIVNKRLLNVCDGILLVDYTKFEQFINKEVGAKELVKRLESLDNRIPTEDSQSIGCMILPKSRRHG